VSEIKHTSTPWTKDRHEQLRGADGRAVNVWGLGIGWASRDDETEGNSELIIDAVNSHASLTAERDRLREALKEIIRKDDTGPIVFELREDGPSQAIGRSEGIFAAIARAALSPVEESK
jgi:hypothetical protein